MNNFDILKMKDKNEKNRISKLPLFDIPFRILVVGKSQYSGKGNFIGNMLLRKKYYRDYFDGDNIYIVSPSVSKDDKYKTMIEELDIPSRNIFKKYDEEGLKDLYNDISDDFEERKNDNLKPQNFLIVFDDISYKGDLKKHNHGIISEIFCNGRHIQISTIVTAQKYSDILTTARENCTGCVLFDCSTKQLDLMSDDHNRLNTKKEFTKMFRNTTKEKHSFMVINYANNPIYLDSNFKPILPTKDV